MTTQLYPYRPNYGVPPGWVIEERIQAQDISSEELADRCGLAPELVNDNYSGRFTPITLAAGGLV